MAATSLSSVLTAVRARIAAQVSGLTLSPTLDTIRNDPAHLIDRKFSVFPSYTRNDRTTRQSKGVTHVTDRITVEIGCRLASGDQVTAFDAGLDVAEDVLIALTNPTWWKATAGLHCVEYVDERRDRREGYVLFSQTFELTREAELG